MAGGLGVDYSFDAVSNDRTRRRSPSMRWRPAAMPWRWASRRRAIRASYSPFNMVFTEKKVSGTFYGSVRPDLDFRSWSTTT